MPFPTQDSKPFTKQRVENLKVGQIGVYGLFRSDTWVYIGRGHIRARLLDHLGGDNPCITKENPDQWVDIVTSEDVQKEKELIAEFQPVCNKKIG